MSAIPAFLDALVPALKASPELNGWHVFDGPPTQYSSLPKVLMIGVATQDLTIESGITTAGLRAQREQADVNCMSRAWSGDPQDDILSARRADAFAGYAAVRAMLTADPTLNGTTKRARIVSVVYTPFRDSRGTSVEVEFGIRLDDI